jgi:hypothetical protein
MPRYVILEHDHPHLHWDLMLEEGAVLRTWRLAAPPHEAQAVAVEPSFDHRLHYLDYEGPISGGRGQVTRWDHGTYSWGDVGADHLSVCLTGVRLHGVLEMRRVTGDRWAAVYSVGSLGEDLQGS